MKVFKLIWFIVSVSMIGISGYFLATKETKTDKQTPQKIVKQVLSKDYQYNEDHISLNNGVTESEAKLVINNFENAFSNNSWWWMPKEKIINLASLDNKYRLAIAANRIKIINNKNLPDEKYELNNFKDEEIMTKTAFKKAWEATVGLGIVLTDGDPCDGIDYCNVSYEYDQVDDHYNILNNENDKIYASLVKYSEISKDNNLYTLTIKALYIYENNGVYSLYSDPSKINKLLEINTPNTNNLPINSFLKQNSEAAFNKANTYQYTFLKEGTNYLFNSYNFIKGK